jgi:predicted GNAT family acetyltransferase
MPMSHTLIHNENECKYEYHIDGHCVYITYEDKEGKMHLTHTIVPEELAGKGLARTLLEDVLEEIKKAGKKAVAECSYIVKYQEKNPDKRDLFA